MKKLNHTFTLTAVCAALALLTAGPAAEAVTFTAFDAPSTVAAPTGKIIKGSDGNMYFTRGDTKLSRVTASGQVRTMNLDSVLVNNTPTPIPLTGLVSASGRLYFTSEPNRSLLDVAPWIFTQPNPSPLLLFSTSFPAGFHLQAMAYGSDNRFYILDPVQNSVIAANSVFYTPYTIPTAASAPVDITVGPDDALWFTESATNKIGRLTTAGQIADYASFAGGQPQAITTGPDGGVWFTDLAKDSIGRIDPTTHAVTEYPSAAVPNSSPPERTATSGTPCPR
jgi:hypothetical protein